MEGEEFGFGVAGGLGKSRNADRFEGAEGGLAEAGGQRVGGAVGAGENDGVTVGIAEPAFPMIGAAVAGGRVAVPRKEDAGAEGGGAGEGGVEVVEFEPEEDAVAVGFGAGVADGAMVVLDGPGVELEDESAVVDEALVFGAAVVASASEEALVPATAGFDVLDGD